MKIPPAFSQSARNLSRSSIKTLPPHPPKQNEKSSENESREKQSMKVSTQQTTNKQTQALNNPTNPRSTYQAKPSQFNLILPSPMTYYYSTYCPGLLSQCLFRDQHVTTLTTSGLRFIPDLESKCFLPDPGGPVISTRFVSTHNSR